MALRHDKPLRGRGALGNPDNRYDTQTLEYVDDGWGSLEARPDRIPTELHVDRARSVIAYNDSPDVPFDRSINPYRGCEHGCIYCFARPAHAWLGWSPGLDFETRLTWKPDAPEILRRELARPGYRCAPLALGINTDAYQPIERRLRLTRRLLEVLAGCGHPVSIVTKSAGVERDLDLLVPMAEAGRVSVAVSLTTLDATLARRMEPRAAAPHRRLQTIRRLSEAGVPVSVLVAPVIPVLTDGELEALLAAAREAGALDAGHVLLRLPREVAPLFEEWLAVHEPGRAAHVLARLRDCRGGALYDSRFGARMTGTGPYADLIAQRFRLARRRLGFPGLPPLDCSGFRPPRAGDDRQLDLF